MKKQYFYILFASCILLTSVGCFDAHDIADGICGDGHLNRREQCDDGNTQDGDGCSSTCLFEVPSPSLCGNGLADKYEECDDGNKSSNDGCSAGCKVEKGWTCPKVGACTPICGDGLVVDSKECDDGNKKDGDGCSAACVKEVGWVCKNVPSVKAPDLSVSECKPDMTDGRTVGNEECDDQNIANNDGCNANHLVERGYYCYYNGTKSICKQGYCGDGMIADGGTEQCDDGNNVDGDGCSKDCKVEPDYHCVDLVNQGVGGVLPPKISIPVTYKWIGKDNFVGANANDPGKTCPFQGFQLQNVLVSGYPAMGDKCTNPLYDTIFSTKTPKAEITQYETFKLVDDANGKRYQWKSDENSVNSIFKKWRDSNGEPAKYVTAQIHLLVNKDTNKELVYHYYKVDDCMVYVNGKAVINQPGWNLNITRNRTLTFAEGNPPGDFPYHLDIFLAKRDDHWSQQVEIPVDVIGPQVCVKSAAAVCGDGKLEPLLNDTSTALDPDKNEKLCEDGNKDNGDGCSSTCQQEINKSNCSYTPKGLTIACS